MNIEEFRQHCMAIKGATESLPFIHHNVLVFKIMGKMFAMVSLAPKDRVFAADLKCDPDYSIELKERYDGIVPGHVKTANMWHRVVLESDVPNTLIVELIRHSVDEVVKAMPKSLRRQYEEFLKDE